MPNGASDSGSAPSGLVWSSRPITRNANGLATRRLPAVSVKFWPMRGASAAASDGTPLLPAQPAPNTRELAP
jgi:hypothetical protein